MNIDKIIQTRKNFINLINGLDIDQLNKIPEGFNNNIIWNFGHIIVTQQLLCNKLSGLPLLVDNETLESFRKGSKPEKSFSTEDLEKLKSLSITNLEALKKDLEQDKFSEYQAYTTSFGISLNNISEAIAFNAMHEAMHLGYVMAQKRALLS